jgi:hypothetical protein
MKVIPKVFHKAHPFFFSVTLFGLPVSFDRATNVAIFHPLWVLRLPAVCEISGFVISRLEGFPVWTDLGSGII